MKWWKKILIAVTFPVSLPTLWVISRCKAKHAMEQEMMPEIVECAMHRPMAHDMQISGDIVHYIPTETHTYVGATVPSINSNNTWSKFRALVYTEETKELIDDTFVSEPTSRPLSSGCNVTIIPRSTQAIFKPELRKDIPWLDDFIDENFYIKLLPGHQSADIELRFTADDINIPFGTVTMTVSPHHNQAQTIQSQRSVIYFLYSPTDAGFVDHIQRALDQIGCQTTRNIEQATRVQLIYSEYSHGNLEILSVAQSYHDKLAITYYDPRMLEHITRNWDDVPHSYYSNNLNNMFRDIQAIKDNQAYMISMLKQCMDMLTANFNAICDSSEVIVPHIFHVWPAARPRGVVARLNPKNWVYYRYRLHLLCEGIYQETGLDSDRQHYVFADHPGYRIDMPKEWFAKWGPILAMAAKITSIACKIALTATGAGSLTSLIPDGLSLDVINEALPILDIVSEELTDKDMSTLVAEKGQEYLEDFDRVLSEEEDMKQVTDNELSFAQLAQFLKGREPAPENAGLQRCYYPQSSVSAGKAVWLCKKCAAKLNNGVCEISYV